MRENTYVKLELIQKKHKGYISTHNLLDEGITNRQIKILMEENYLEKVCFGYYWFKQGKNHKPNDYKCIEAGLSNPRAVICLDSACYYQGILSKEPEYLSVATGRTDRSSMKMNFGINRHYFSEKYIEIGSQKVNTEYGNYNIYKAERSVWDMIRLKENIPIELLNKKNVDREFQERILKYASLFKMKGHVDER